MFPKFETTHNNQTKEDFLPITNNRRSYKVIISNSLFTLLSSSKRKLKWF